MNKTRLAEKRYRDKLKKETRLNDKTHKEQNKQKRKTKEEYNKYNHELRNTKKKKTKLQKKRPYELIKRSVLIRKQNELSKEIKQMKNGRTENI